MNQTQEFCYLRSAENPEGAILPKKQARISPDDRGFYFADGVYEVMRTYSGKLFRQRDHLSRFQNSLSAVRIELPDVDAIGAICLQLLRHNQLNDQDVFFYIQATRGVWQRNLPFPPQTVIPTLYISVTPIIPPETERTQGINVITVPDIRWQRCDIKSIGLLPSVLARQAATEANALEAIFVRNGILTEGTHTNLFAVKKGVVVTHPLNNHILPGVTRTVVLELCRLLNLPVSERPIQEKEQPEIEEIFVTSTTWEIVPVIMVNGKPVANGKPGPITRQLQQSFQKYCIQNPG
ncbi:MAG: D-amino acid aminotransferase [bacterium]